MTMARVLHLEDSDLDAELVKDRLERSGLAVTIELACTRRDFTARLQSQPYDLILSDYQLPAFTGLAALELARTHQPDTPFVFVSGTMGEEFAIETLKQGATDYVLKQNLARLPAAVERAIADAHARRERRLAEERAARDLRASETRLMYALKAGRMGTWDFDVTTYVLTTSETCRESYGRSPQDPFTFTDLSDAIHPEDQPRWMQIVQQAVDRAGDFEIEYRVRWPDGALHWVHVRGGCTAAVDGRATALSGVSFDITARKQNEQDFARLLADEKRHTALLEQVAIASRSVNAVLSADNIVRVVAEEARSIIGAELAATALVGEDGAPQIRAVARTSGPVTPAPGTATGPDRDLMAAVCRDGRPLRLGRDSVGRGRLAVPLIGPGGKSLGAVQLVARDGAQFTSRDEAVAIQLAAIAAVGLENARLYELVREQDKRKDEFLATLAHELRNPLAPVRHGLYLLKVVGDGEQGQKIQDMMERQLGHMVRLIDDLMDVSRITRGRVELRKERVELRTVVDSALEVSRRLVETAGHTLTVRVPSGLHLEADPTRIAQVIENLLNNAAKYTPNGGRITLSAETEGPMLVVRVADTGVGIPLEMQRRVFDMFTQIGRTLERAQGGLGIGLTLVRRLVEMHGGTVEVESPGPGAGSTFIVRLPAAAAVQPAPAQPAPGPGTAAAGLRLLIVDDSIDGAESLSLLLQIGGHETTMAHSGPDALTAAAAFRPDVVFLDIGLPGMDGYEVAKSLRATDAHKGTILVALTGWGSESDRRRSKEAGFDHHLTKPVDVSYITRLLAELSAGGSASRN